MCTFWTYISIHTKIIYVKLLDYLKTMRNTPNGWKSPTHPEDGSEDDRGYRYDTEEKEELFFKDAVRGSGFLFTSFTAVLTAAGVALLVENSPIRNAGLGILGTIAAATLALGLAERRSRKYRPEDQ